MSDKKVQATLKRGNTYTFMVPAGLGTERKDYMFHRDEPQVVDAVVAGLLEEHATEEVVIQEGNEYVTEYRQKFELLPVGDDGVVAAPVVARKRTRTAQSE